MIMQEETIMSENKDKKTENIVLPVSKVTDEELDNIVGGGSFVYRGSKKCPTPGCDSMVPLDGKDPVTSAREEAAKSETYDSKRRYGRLRQDRDRLKVVRRNYEQKH